MRYLNQYRFLPVFSILIVGNIVFFNAMFELDFTHEIAGIDNNISSHRRFDKINLKDYNNLKERHEGLDDFKSDENPDTIILVKDINRGKASSSPINFFNINNALVFMASDGIPDGSMVRGIWKSDGTEVGTVMVKDVNCGFAGQIQINIDGTVFFGGGPKWELWKTNGTSEGTTLVKDILPGQWASCPQKFGIASGKLIFVAVTKYGPLPVLPILSTAIFISDGTTQGTIPLNIPNVGTSFIGSVDLNDTSFIFCNNKIYQCDKTFENISVMKQFDNTEPGWYIYYPHKVNDSFMIIVLFDGNVSNTSQLWKSNGSPEGTILLKDSFKNYIQNITNVNNNVFFTADDGIHGTELWKTNGTLEGTELVKDVFPGISGSNPGNLIAFKGRLYFTANNGINGNELWTSDGTSNGTFLILDISIGSVNSQLANMLIHKNILFFTIINEDGITELWNSDGTPTGTFAIKSLTTDSNSSVSNLFFIKDDLYFARNDTVYGEELWKYVLPLNGPYAINSIYLSDYKIYPNPAHDIIYILSPEENKHIIISDLCGHLVFNEIINGDTLNISFLTSGIYIISVNHAKFKLIKI